MRKIFLFLISILLIGFAFSCKQRADEKHIQMEDSLTINKVKLENIIIPSDSGVVVLTLSDGRGIANIQKEKDQTVYIEFQSQGYKNISARLSSLDSLANIRISQIFIPDGIMDGPFGRDMQYKLAIDGVYRLSVHENMMAGDPWNGVFTAEITLTK